MPERTALKTAITRFLEDSTERLAERPADEKAKLAPLHGAVSAFLTNEGFVDYLAESWHGGAQVVAIVEGTDGNVRGSLVARADAFKFSTVPDRFSPDARLIMSANAEGVVFMELGPIPQGSA